MRMLLETGLANALSATLLALIVAAASKFCRRPSLVFCLWALVLIKFITPPLVRIPVGGWHAAVLQTVGEIFVVHGPATAESTPQSDAWLDPDWPRVLIAVWIAGSIGWAGLVLVRLHRFRLLVRQAPLASAPLLDEAARLSRLLGIGTCPEVRMVHGRLPPLMWAIGSRPVVLLPSDLWEQLAAEQRTTLLAHELSHLKRRDHWFRWLELLVLSVYWWHPVAWWARRELERAEERCCDALVLWTFPELATAYGHALLDTIDFLAGPRSTLPPVALGFGHVRHLKTRLAAIADGHPRPNLSRGSRWAVALGGLVILPCSPLLWNGPTSLPSLAATPTGVRELDGRWLVTSVVQNGQPVPDEDVKKMQYVVAGNRHTFRFADLLFTGVHHLHPAAQPKAIDIALTGGVLTSDLLEGVEPTDGGASDEPIAPGGSCHGIYELRDNVLKLCVAFGRTRPDEFSSPPGSGRMLVVYRRASP
ncbi:MAG TPA: M56 family metallopeptidase [Pirellulales bacterium]|nr:M56 family metallopeptidase [Pirellulales bacterium]